MSDIYLRKATASDLDITFEWANDSETRANSFNQKPISFDEHSNWFSAKLNDDKCLIYILMAGNSPSGILRLAMDENDIHSAEISYTIAPSERGKGLGSRLIGSITTLSELKTYGIHTLKASVKPENYGSQKCFEKSGYRITSKTEEEIVFELDI